MNEKTNAVKWVMYRFFTRSVDDCRPLVFDARYPWWCTGEAGDGSYVVIVAYLPETEPLTRYWDDVYDVESMPVDSITFSDRFPKPDGFIEVADDSA